jgi:hypothetical protein
MLADVANLRQAIDALKEKGIWVVAAEESGDLLYDEVDYRGPTALVVGGEGEGIRRLVLEGCDQVVRIPMEGHVASLNAAAAGTVLLYEALRQRRRDAAPPGTRTPRLEAVETAQDAPDNGEPDVAEAAEPDVTEESAPPDEDLTSVSDDPGAVGATLDPAAQEPEPKKRATRARAKKKT